MLDQQNVHSQVMFTVAYIIRLVHSVALPQLTMSRPAAFSGTGGVLSITDKTPLADNACTSGRCTGGLIAVWLLLLAGRCRSTY